MRILLRVCLHALLIFIAFNILDAAVTHKGSVVLERILSYLNYMGFTIFSLIAAATANGQRAVLAVLLVFLILIAIPLDFAVTIRIIMSIVGGIGFGLILRSLVAETAVQEQP
jgi:hypothetical protein